MLYEYQCEECKERVEKDLSIGKAPRTVKCRCGATAKRVYNSFALSINGSIDRKISFGEELKKQNKRAAHRQRGRKAPVTTIAYDYGNGRVEEVGK